MVHVRIKAASASIEVYLPVNPAQTGTAGSISFQVSGRGRVPLLKAASTLEAAVNLHQGRGVSSVMTSLPLIVA